MMISKLDTATSKNKLKKHTTLANFKRRFNYEIFLHLLVLPAVVYVFVFNYIPMYGITVAFKDYSYFKGILGSPWVGFDYFIEFFGSFYFWRLIKNTLLISFYSIIFGFPIPIIFALMLNEIRNKQYKKVIQTVSYFPHFVSTVIVVGMMFTFLSPVDGIVNIILQKFGVKEIDFMRKKEYFRFLYVFSGIWQGFGWSSIVYLASLTGIPNEIYEAAIVDGANKYQQLINITIPGILPTAVILLILSIGGLMNVGFEKVMLMYSPSIYEVSDVIATYVYRKSILGGEFSFGTAVGLFNNVINLILVLIANRISKRTTEVSLW